MNEIRDILAKSGFHKVINFNLKKIALNYCTVNSKCFGSLIDDNFNNYLEEGISYRLTKKVWYIWNSIISFYWRFIEIKDFNSMFLYFLFTFLNLINLNRRFFLLFFRSVARRQPCLSPTLSDDSSFNNFIDVPTK